MCRLFRFSRSNLCRVTTMRRVTDLTGLPVCLLVEWSTDGVVLGADFASSGYDERVNIVKWPIRLPSSLIKHDWDRFDEENSLRVVTITRAKYRRLVYSRSDIAQWSADLQASFSSQDEILNSESSKETEQECCWRQMMASNELKNLELWYQMLEFETVSAET